MKYPFTLSQISFRWQIVILAAVAFGLFLAVLFAMLSAFGYTKSAVLEDEENHLWTITRGLAQEYSHQAEFARSRGRVPPLDAPWEQDSQQAMALLGRSVLGGSHNIRDGFYSPANDVLIGSFFGNSPSSSSLALDQDAMASAQATVAQVGRSAFQGREEVQKIQATTDGVILIQAVPIRDNGAYVGSAWTMAELAELPGSNRFRSYSMLVVLGIAALSCVILTILIVRNLQRGVRKIETGLENLEYNLGSQIPPANDPEEIQRIAQAINRLGASLQENIQRERATEQRMRHSERLAALGRLVAGVAHEVRNPLATIRLRVQMCQQQPSDAELKESCSMALQEIQRLDRIVSRLLSFGEPMNLHKEQANIGELLQSRLANFREKAVQSGVTVEMDARDQGKLALVDSGRIAQVFDNIIQNAVEAMAASGGTLLVSVNPASSDATSEGIAVEFKDSGEGISDENMDHVFDPFFTTKPSGTGIGLSICHELVQAHGGMIQIESRKHHGTIVHVFIPSHDSRTVAASDARAGKRS